MTTPMMLLCLLPLACATPKAEPATAEPDDATSDASEPVAHAELYDRSGLLVGDATFSPIENGVAIDVDVYELPPGVHGFHIHETGDCDAPSFKSAGGHFNPLGADHGFGDDPVAHLGDLPNLPVGADGRVESRFLVEGVTLREAGQRSLLADDGTALVVHAEDDDYQTDPAGAAGPRIACGVIESL